CSASVTDLFGTAAPFAVGAEMGAVVAAVVGAVAGGFSATGVAGSAVTGSGLGVGGGSAFGGAFFVGGFASSFNAPFDSRPVSRLTKRPSSTGGICTETSSPSGFGSFSSNRGRMTAAASASTIAPTRRRRALRFNSSTAKSALSAMRSAISHVPLGLARREDGSDRQERAKDDNSISFDRLVARGPVRRRDIVEGPDVRRFHSRTQQCIAHGRGRGATRTRQRS